MVLIQLCRFAMNEVKIAHETKQILALDFNERVIDWFDITLVLCMLATSSIL
jgi:hypothetical protein